jgi:hypothetical protein
MPGFAGARRETEPDFVGAVFLALFFGVAARGVTARQAIVAKVAHVEKRIRIQSILSNRAVPASSES